MSYRYERYRERPRRGWGWIKALTVLVWLLLIGLLLARFVARPLITDLVEGRIAQRITVPRTVEEAPPAEDVVPENPEPGSFTVTEADANQWVAEHRSELEGVEDVRFRFVPGEAQADLTIAGVTSTARAGVAVQDGRIVTVNPRLDPPLGLVVDVQPFASLIENRLNSDLATTGRTVTGVEIQQGQVVISIA